MKAMAVWQAHFCNQLRLLEVLPWGWPTVWIICCNYWSGCHISELQGVPTLWFIGLASKYCELQLLKTWLKKERERYSPSYPRKTMIYCLTNRKITRDHYFTLLHTLHNNTQSVFPYTPQKQCSWRPPPRNRRNHVTPCPLLSLGSKKIKHSKAEPALEQRRSSMSRHSSSRHWYSPERAFCCFYSEHSFPFGDWLLIPTPPPCTFPSSDFSCHHLSSTLHLFFY